MRGHKGRTTSVGANALIVCSLAGFWDVLRETIIGDKDGVGCHLMRGEAGPVLFIDGESRCKYNVTSGIGSPRALLTHPNTSPTHAASPF